MAPARIEAERNINIKGGQEVESGKGINLNKGGIDLDLGEDGEARVQTNDRYTEVKLKYKTTGFNGVNEQTEDDRLNSNDPETTVTDRDGNPIIRVTHR